MKVRYFLLILLVLLCVGCKMKKDPMSVDRFKQEMELRNLTIDDNSFTLKGNVVMAYNDVYQIYFYVYDSSKEAKDAFSDKQDSLKNSIKGSYSQNSENMFNNNKYILKNNGHIYIISRIENTIMFVDGLSEDSNELKELFDDLGY